jgi:hypothetical protein
MTMKKALLLLIAVCLCSCIETTNTRTVMNVGGTDFHVIEVDSCEYLICHEGYQGYMAHKGNCKYCEQRRAKNKEL